MSTARQLRRLLAVLPHLADRAERRYEELAELVGAEWQSIRDDLYALSQRDDEPGGFVEEVQLFFSARGVRAFSSQFHRPMRLSGSEAAALELGLAMSVIDHGAADLAAMERARERLRAVRTPAHDESSLARRHVELPAEPLALPDDLCGESARVRHVLQFGPDAEVLEPAALREEIVARLRAIEARLAAR